MILKHLLFSFLLMFCLHASLSAQSKVDTLTNKSIIELKKINLSSELITLKINTTYCNFDLSVDGLSALKKAGISDDLITAMLKRQNEQNQKIINGDENLRKNGTASGTKPDIQNSASLNENGFSEIELNGKKYVTKYHLFTFLESSFGTFSDEKGQSQLSFVTQICLDSNCNSKKSFAFTIFTTRKNFVKTYPVYPTIDETTKFSYIPKQIGNVNQASFKIGALIIDTPEFEIVKKQYAGRSLPNAYLDVSAASPVRKVKAGSIEIKKYDINNRLVSGAYFIDVELFDRTKVVLKGKFSDVSF